MQIPASWDMDAFVHVQLLTLSGCDNVRKTMVLELRNIRVCFSVTPTLVLDFWLSFLEAAQIATLSDRAVYSHVQLHKDGASGTSVPVFWDITRGKQQKYWFSPSLLARRKCLFLLLGRSSILLFQGCLLFKVHLLRGFLGGNLALLLHGILDFGWWASTDYDGLLCREIYYSSCGRLATYPREWAPITGRSYPCTIQTARSDDFCQNFHSWFLFLFLSLEEGSDDHSVISGSF